MSEPDIFLHRPIHHQPEAQHEQSVRLLSLEAIRRGIKLSEAPVMTGDSLVQRVRNTITDQFLKSGATHMMCIDADISFRAHSVFDLLNTGAGVVGCAYRKKYLDEREIVKAVMRGEEHPLEWGSQYAYEELEEPSDETVGGCIEVRQLATGFLMIKREVIVRMMKANPKWWHHSGALQTYGDPMFSIFDCYIDDDGRYLSEDYAFCERWRAMGGKIWCYLDAELEHHGSYAFRGNLKDYLSHREPDGFHMPPLDPVAKQDLIDILRGSYDVPVDDVASVLDIGANVGAFSVWARKRWPRAAIDAYEPHPVSYSYLVKNTKCGNQASPENRKDEQTLALRVAVREYACTMALREGGPNAGCASFHDIGEQSAREIQVECVGARTLPSCDIVKIDTEGCEVEILEHLDISRTKAVMLEWHRDSDVPILEELLREFNITKHQTEPNRGIMKAVRR